MKSKHYSFLRACFLYFIIAPIFGGFVNYALIKLVATIENPLMAQCIGIFLSFASFTVIALWLLQDTRVNNLSDIRLGCLMFLVALLGTCAMTGEFYNEFSDMMRWSADGNRVIGRLWFASTGLGFGFGLVILSLGSFWTSPDMPEKPKTSS